MHQKIQLKSCYRKIDDQLNDVCIFDPKKKIRLIIVNYNVLYFIITRLKCLRNDHSKSIKLIVYKITAYYVAAGLSFDVYENTHTHTHRLEGICIEKKKTKNRMQILFG